MISIGLLSVLGLAVVATDTGADAARSERCDHPEVGFLFKRVPGTAGATPGATGTLVAANLVLTAGHMLAEGFVPDFFAVNPGCANSRIFRVAGGRFVPGTGGAPLALLQLTESVPANLATPRRLATRAPRKSVATVVGFGCRSFPRRPSAPQKSAVEIWVTDASRFSDYVSFGPDRAGAACEGDAGAPVLDETGKIFWVVTGYQDFDSYTHTHAAVVWRPRQTIERLSTAMVTGQAALPIDLASAPVIPTSVVGHSIEP